MDFQFIALNARKSCLLAVHEAKAPHVGSALSCIDLVTFFLSRCINQDFKAGEKNQFVMSKGHAAIAVYSVLYILGEITRSQFQSFCQNGSQFYGHVSHLAHHSVELSTGSLGHGMPYGLGLAHAKQLKKEEGLVFVLMSDGELNEGTTWESALIANKLKLSNLVCIVDRNNLQSLESTEKTLPLEPLEDKWSSFGWEVTEIDGHDFESMAKVDFVSQKPKLVIANTVKGKGIDWMENQVIWHYKSPDSYQLNQAFESLESYYT